MTAPGYCPSCARALPCECVPPRRAVEVESAAKQSAAEYDRAKSSPYEAAWGLDR